LTKTKRKICLQSPLAAAIKIFSTILIFHSKVKKTSLLTRITHYCCYLFSTHCVSRDKQNFENKNSLPARKALKGMDL
jgi:hypothetical protein